jgi:hypothetical protein
MFGTMLTNRTLSYACREALYGQRRLSDIATRQGAQGTRRANKKRNQAKPSLLGLLKTSLRDAKEYSKEDGIHDEFKHTKHGFRKKFDRVSIGQAYDCSCTLTRFQGKETIEVTFSTMLQADPEENGDDDNDAVEDGSSPSVHPLLRKVEEDWDSDEEGM